MAERVVLITGSSRGIGAAAARLAGQRGYAVAVNYLSNRLLREAPPFQARRYIVPRLILWVS